MEYRNLSKEIIWGKGRRIWGRGFYTLKFSFSAPVWELVTSDWKRFSNNPEESSADLSEDERVEWTQVFNEALTKSKCLNGGAKFVEGYKFV